MSGSSDSCARSVRHQVAKYTSPHFGRYRTQTLISSGSTHQGRATLSKHRSNCRTCCGRQRFWMFIQYSTIVPHCRQTPVCKMFGGSVDHSVTDFLRVYRDFRVGPCILAYAIWTDGPNISQLFSTIEIRHSCCGQAVALDPGGLPRGSLDKPRTGNNVHSSKSSGDHESRLTSRSCVLVIFCCALLCTQECCSFELNFEQTWLASMLCKR